MDLHQLRCFVAAAEELHFGRAAQRLDMLPSALGRFIRLLEDDLGTRLMTRTTRSVALTDDGAVLLKEARTLLAQADALAGRFRTRGRKRAAIIRGCRRHRQRRRRTVAAATARFPAAPARRHRATGRGQDGPPVSVLRPPPAPPPLFFFFFFFLKKFPAARDRCRRLPSCICASRKRMTIAPKKKTATISP